MKEEPRPCERLCKRCQQWKHHSRFRSWKDSRPGRDGSISAFSPVCKDCEQKERNEKKNVDRPLTIIRNRAKSAARDAKTTIEFFWTQMNWSALVEPYRAALHSPCLCCGHKPLNERDVQIEHIEAPRWETDWARLHARNIRFFCQSCNGTKGKKSHVEWLDEQEGARLSNQADPVAAELRQRVKSAEEQDVKGPLLFPEWETQ
jgi:hypothetical protein